VAEGFPATDWIQGVSRQDESAMSGINRRHLVLILVCLPLYIALCLFLPAGSWTWVRGWLFTLVFVVASVFIFVFLWRVNPEVVFARSHSHEGTKRWDKILLWFLFPAMLVIVPVSALDAGRFHWFPVPWWVCAVGYAFLLIGMGITTWAEAVNKFFEVTVRIQEDRGQSVIDTGPYAIVRHPGYFGGFFTAIGTALSLGSLWALIPVGFMFLLLIVRTQWEDQTLQNELAGYREYTQRVRFRLIPGVW
jgi:protein-S-isoprenylcysteine O-methyltransferase Ste14